MSKRFDALLFDAGGVFVVPDPLTTGMVLEPFGGKYFCHDVRVIRLPRHGASCPVAMAVSCSADRQALGKITKDGVFLEQLEQDPARFLPEINEEDLSTEVVNIDLNRPMSEVRATLSKYPVKTRVMLNKSKLKPN